MLVHIDVCTFMENFFVCSVEFVSSSKHHNIVGNICLFRRTYLHMRIDEQHMCCSHCYQHPILALLRQRRLKQCLHSFIAAPRNASTLDVQLIPERMNSLHLFALICA
uniref:Secreted protein n=1 Tax=Ascaris lumbricoides TaxID=6252 RepID=A0A0M3HIR0_ASCLU